MEVRTEGLGAFWHSMKLSRRRPELPVPTPIRRDPPERRANLRAIPIDRATAAQQKRRNVLRAEKLAADYVGMLSDGHYAFRALKEAFDAFCEEAEIMPVTDKRFAAWLKQNGGHRYRTDYPKVTMYQIERRRAPARSAA